MDRVWFRDLLRIAVLLPYGTFTGVFAQADMFWGVTSSAYQVSAGRAAARNAQWQFSDYLPTPSSESAVALSSTLTAVVLPQFEGAVDANGRGSTIWDTFSHTTGKIADGSTGDVADDFYDQYADDISLMQANGIKNFRFSIAWSRIYPTGTGTVRHSPICCAQTQMTLATCLADLVHAVGILSSA